MPLDLRRRVTQYYDLPSSFQDLMPVSRYILFDIARYQPTDLADFAILTRMILTAFKNAFNLDIIQVIQEVLLVIDAAYRIVENKLVSYYTELSIRYMQRTNAEITEQAIEEQSNRLDGKGKQVMD